MPGKRAKERQLMRWTVEHDQRLLLCIQYTCNEKGIKLPWEAIAKQLDPKATEGAVSQHLAKLRARLIEQGQEVPPSLRRGGTVSTPRLSVGGASAGTPANDPVEQSNPGSLVSSNEQIGSSPEERAASDEDYEPHPAKRLRKTSSRRQVKGKNQTGTQIKRESGGSASRTSTPQGKVPGSGTSKKTTTHSLGDVESEHSGTEAETHISSYVGQNASYLNFAGPRDDTHDQGKETNEGLDGIVILRVRPGYTSRRFPMGLAQWPQGLMLEGSFTAADVKANADGEKEDDLEVQSHNTGAYASMGDEGHSMINEQKGMLEKEFPDIVSMLLPSGQYLAQASGYSGALGGLNGAMMPYTFSDAQHDNLPDGGKLLNAEDLSSQIPPQPPFGTSERQDIPTFGVSYPAGQDIAAFGASYPAGQDIPGLGASYPAGQDIPTFGASYPAEQDMPTFGASYPAGQDIPTFGDSYSAGQNLNSWELVLRSQKGVHANSQPTAQFGVPDLMAEGTTKDTSFALGPQATPDTAGATNEMSVLPEAKVFDYSQYLLSDNIQDDFIFGPGTNAEM